jgi:hypothetical protein
MGTVLWSLSSFRENVMLVSRCRCRRALPRQISRLPPVLMALFTECSAPAVCALASVFNRLKGPRAHLGHTHKRAEQSRGNRPLPHVYHAALRINDTLHACLLGGKLISISASVAVMLEDQLLTFLVQITIDVEFLFLFRGPNYMAVLRLRQAGKLYF